MAFLFLLFIIVPITGILLLAWLLSKNNIYGKIAGILWLGIFGLATLGYSIRYLTDKKVLEKEDYYGEYIIDRNFFPGTQADWQYEHYRFEIKHNDSIYLYETDKEQILKTHRGMITTTDPISYGSARLILDSIQPMHHIMATNPTTYRSAWSFYLVFNSPKFGNMFFRKGQWKPLQP